MKKIILCFTLLFTYPLFAEDDIYFGDFYKNVWFLKAIENLKGSSCSSQSEELSTLLSFNKEIAGKRKIREGFLSFNKVESICKGTRYPLICKYYKEAFELDEMVQVVDVSKIKGGTGNLGADTLFKIEFVRKKLSNDKFFNYKNLYELKKNPYLGPLYDGLFDKVVTVAQMPELKEEAIKYCLPIADYIMTAKAVDIALYVGEMSSSSQIDLANAFYKDKKMPSQKDMNMALEKCEESKRMRRSEFILNGESRLKFCSRSLGVKAKALKKAACKNKLFICEFL